MKNLTIKTTYGAGSERIINKNSLQTIGTVRGSARSNNRIVTMPYTNIQIGTLVKDFSGKEYFKSNYELGQGTRVRRTY